MAKKKSLLENTRMVIATTSPYEGALMVGLSLLLLGGLSGLVYLIYKMLQVDESTTAAADNNIPSNNNTCTTNDDCDVGLECRSNKCVPDFLYEPVYETTATTAPPSDSGLGIVLGVAGAIVVVLFIVFVYFLGIPYWEGMKSGFAEEERKAKSKFKESASKKGYEAGQKKRYWYAPHFTEQQRTDFLNWFFDPNMVSSDISKNYSRENLLMLKDRALRKNMKKYAQEYNRTILNPT